MFKYSDRIKLTKVSEIWVMYNKATKGPKLIHSYTPLIGPEAWLSTMGKRRMSSASTSVFYQLPHLQIHTSAFYYHPVK